MKHCLSWSLFSHTSKLNLTPTHSSWSKSYSMDRKSLAVCGAVAGGVVGVVGAGVIVWKYLKGRWGS